MLRSRPLRVAARVLATIALLAIAVWAVGAERLRQQLLHVDHAWLAGAVAAAALAQWVSVWRWGTIARIFGLRVRLRALAVAYAQGMTLNVLLPGATLGGDALRSLRLQALGNPLGVSALTVLLDRLSGLWVLCALSLVTGIGLAAIVGLDAMPGPGAASFAPAAPPAAASGGAAGWFLGYLAGLAVLCAIPWLPVRRRAAPGAAPTAAAGWAARLWNRICELHDLAIAQRAPLGRSLWSSLLVQVLCALTLWLCALAAGGDARYWQVQAVAAPVFVAGALPLSYGGFGARELTALIAFPLVGLPADLGLAASALYGIVAIILGVAAAPSFAAPAGDRKDG
jgi:uncharacterized membrane protein YbhN (UPF0104 family)